MDQHHAPRPRLPFEGPLLTGVLLRRYKRFLADVRLDDGAELTVHCANPGRMTTCSTPGSPVWLAPSGGRLSHRLEVVIEGGVPVGVNPLRANKVVERALRARALPPFAGLGLVRREANIPSGAGRADFLLQEPASAGGRPVWLEVKSVTLVEHGVARFPDAVTERGRRHLMALAERVAAGERAALLFLVQRGDARRVIPAADVDLEYAEAFATARAAGVETYAFATDISPAGLAAARALPVDVV